MHFPGYQGLETAGLEAVCDLDEAVAMRRAEQWGMKRWYTDYHDMLADPKIDMVEIILPHKIHKRVTIEALEAGKQVSVQKPMAMNIAECDAMIEAAKRTGNTLKVFENFVFYPPYRLAKKMLDHGEIGDPLMLRLKLGGGQGGWHVPVKTWLWRLTEEQCGGGPNLFDDGYHKFSLALYFLGPVKSVKAWIGYSFAAIDSPSILTWEHENGARGYYETTFSPNMHVPSRYYGADERVEIIGTKGVIHVTRCTGQMLDLPPIIIYKDGSSKAVHDIPADWQDSFSGSTRDFIDCIIKGREPTLTGEQGKSVMQFMLASYKSHKEGRPVAPGEITE